MIYYQYQAITPKISSLTMIIGEPKMIYMQYVHDALEL